MSLIQISLRSGGPIYQQLKEEVIRLACEGILAPDEQLPSVRALARELGINPNTVAKAYQELESEGVIYSLGGRGSFVSGDLLAAEGVKKEARENLMAAAEKARRVGLTREEAEDVIAAAYEKRGEKP